MTVFSVMAVIVAVAFVVLMLISAARQQER
jgi:hypothetical protein